MKVNRRVILWAALAVILVVLLALALFSGPTATAITGRLVVEVVDGRTERPISGCTVVVVPDGVTAVTDETGCTGEIQVSVARNAHFDSILPQDWGETTLIVYKDGYIPYALFHAQVKPDETRSGPKIYLFADDGSMQGRAFSVIEGPDREWVNALIEQFDPQKTPGQSPSTVPSATPSATAEH